MKALLWLQTLWCIYWLVLVLPWMAKNPSPASIAFSVVAILYGAATSALAMKSRIGWAYSFLPPLLALYFAGPDIVANAIAFAMDDPMYVDSPATIFIVAIQALFCLVPAILLILLLLRARRLVLS